jgi:sugar phosphate isomerase/epimerase
MAMKFGAPVWPFKWEAPYEQTVRRISDLGFDAVELIAWDRSVLREHYTDERIDALTDLVEAEDLEIAQMVSTPGGLASPDADRRRESIEHFEELVEVASKLDATYVNTVAPYPLDLDFPSIKERPLAQEQRTHIPSDLDWQENWENYVDALEECAAVCEEHGTTYTIEPHPYRYVRNAASMLRILDHVDSDAIGMNFDPSHLYPSGELPEVVVYEVGEHIHNVHISDNDAQTNAHWRPGKGKIDWKAVLRALAETGYDGVLSIELEDVPGVSRSGRFGGEAQESTDELDREYVESMDYLRETGESVGIEFE